MKVKISKIEIHEGKYKYGKNVGQDAKTAVFFFSPAGKFNGGNGSRPMRYPVYYSDAPDIYDYYVNNCEAVPAPAVEGSTKKISIISKEAIVKAIAEGKMVQSDLYFGTTLPKDDIDHIDMETVTLPISDGVEEWYRVDPMTNEIVKTHSIRGEQAVIETHHEILYRRMWDEEATWTETVGDQVITHKGKYVPAPGQDPLVLLARDKDAIYRRKLAPKASAATEAPKAEEDDEH